MMRTVPLFLAVFAAGCGAGLKSEGFRSAVVADMDRAAAEKAVRQFFEENYEAIAILDEVPASTMGRIVVLGGGQSALPDSSPRMGHVIGVRRNNDGIRQPGRAAPDPIAADDEHVFTRHTLSSLKRRLHGGEDAAEALVEAVKGGVRLHIRVYRMGRLSGTRELITVLGTASQSDRNLADADRLLGRAEEFLAARRAGPEPAAPPGDQR